MTFTAAVRCASRGIVASRVAVSSSSSSTSSSISRIVTIRSFASGKDTSKHEMPFGLGKVLDISESTDNKIMTDRDRKLVRNNLPDFLPDDLKKEMDELEIDSIEDLDELEETNLDGFNDLGLVPPAGAGTFASPILVPSRRSTRAVGYVDPSSHALLWFNINNDGNTYYIKDLGLFFKMLHIHDEHAFDGAHLSDHGHH